MKIRATYSRRCDADYGVGRLSDFGDWKGFDGHGKGFAFKFNGFHRLVMVMMMLGVGVGVLHFDDGLILTLGNYSAEVIEVGMKREISVLKM